MGMRFIGASLVVAHLLCSTPVAEAQTSERTFQDDTGFMWAVGSFEAALLVTTLGMGIAASECSGMLCGLGVAGVGLVGVFVSLGVAIIAGFVAGANEVPPDVPFVLHQTLFGAATGLALGGGIAGALDAEESAAIFVALLSGVSTGASLATYSGVRLDELMRQSSTHGATSMMTYLPFLLIPLTAGISAAAGASPPVVFILLGSVLLAHYALTIAWAESVADDASPMAAEPLSSPSRTVPVFGWSQPF